MDQSPPKLTSRQVDTLEFQISGKKHWSQKTKHLLGIIKSFYRDITEEGLEWFLETYLPAERKRLYVEMRLKASSDQINNKFTPTAVAHQLSGNFSNVEVPRIGQKYHLSWAFKGSVFVLVKIDGDFCYLDNPKRKRKDLLKAKVSDLRNLNKNI